jgi:hypothetical protein
LLIRSESPAPVDDTEACCQILRRVVRDLALQVTDENRLALEHVMREYMLRINEYQGERKIDNNLLLLALEWQKENLYALMERGEVSKALGFGYIFRLQSSLLRNTRDPEKRRAIRAETRRLRRESRLLSKDKLSNSQRSPELRKIQESNISYTLNKLLALQQEEKGDTEQLRQLIENYKTRANLPPVAPPEMLQENGETENQLIEIAFQLERDYTQEAFENGLITWEKSRLLKQNIDIMKFSL